MFTFKINKKVKKVVVLTLLVLVVMLPMFSFVSVEPVYAQSTVEECEGFWTNLWNPIDCAIPNALKFMMGTIFSIAAWFAVTTAGLLDVTITFTSDVESYNISGIRIAWEVFRDLANMAFIFILLYIAFMTVLQIGGADTKRLVSSVIIVALLVNFSFFFTGAVIDVGNITGGFIYSTLTPMVNTVDGPRRALLGETLTGALRTSSIFNEASIENKTTTVFNMVLIFLVGAIFFFIAGFVFLAGAIMFITRTVVLMLVLILSPIAFVAAILPKTQGVWRQWVSALVGNAAVLPIFLILIAVVVLIAGDNSLFDAAVEGANRAGRSVDPAQQNLTAIAINKGDVGGGTPTTILSYSAIMVNFMVLIGLMIAALKISQAAAGKAGTAVAKVGGQIAGGGLTAGAYGARKTARGINWATTKADDKWDNKFTSGAKRVSGTLAKRSFEFRSTKTGGALVGALASTTGVDVSGGKTAAQAKKEFVDKAKTDKEKTKTAKVDKTNRQLVGANAADAGTIIGRLEKGELAKLDGATLARPEVAQNFSIGDLADIARSSKTTKAQRADIARHASGGTTHGIAVATWLASPAGAIFY